MNALALIKEVAVLLLVIGLLLKDLSHWAEFDASIQLITERWRCANLEGQRRAGLRNLEAAYHYLKEHRKVDDGLEMRFIELRRIWSIPSTSCDEIDNEFDIEVYSQNFSSYPKFWPNWHYRIRWTKGEKAARVR